MKETIYKWKKEIETYMPDVKLPIILMSTKIDLRDDPVQSRKLLVTEMKKPISYQEGELLARKLGCATYVETSALTNAGMDRICELIIKTVDLHRCGGITKNGKKCLVQ